MVSANRLAGFLLAGGGINFRRHPNRICNGISMPVLCMGLFCDFESKTHRRHGVTVTSCAASSTYGAPGFIPCDASTS